MYTFERLTECITYIMWAIFGVFIMNEYTHSHGEWWQGLFLTLFVICNVVNAIIIIRKTILKKDNDKKE